MTNYVLVIFHIPLEGVYLLNREGEAHCGKFKLKRGREESVGDNVVITSNFLTPKGQRVVDRVGEGVTNVPVYSFLLKLTSTPKICDLLLKTDGYE